MDNSSNNNDINNLDIYNKNNIIQKLNITNQYLYTQLSAVYERITNLEYENYNLKNKVDDTQDKYNKLEIAYENLDDSYNNLDKDYNSLLANTIINKSKKRKSYLNNDYNNDYNNELNNNDKIYKKNKLSLPDEQIIKIIENLKNIEDIVNLPKDKLVRHHPDINKLLNIREPLKKLNEMIGLDKIKDELFKHIIYFIINNENIYENNRLHTVIQGPPGVGKTEFGKILGEIYLGMGFLKNNKFKMVKRSDLIGQYLGQTAIKTQEIIDDIIGGVLFIDEAYSLGNAEKRDSYSKECLDTINRNLTENGNKFICIIAGYEQDLQECFFKSNSGLERRFTFKYNIDGYSPDELMEIFLVKCKLTNWECNIDKNKLFEFFKEYKLPYFAGDIDRLIFQSQLIASLRIFKENKDNKENKEEYIKNIILNDIKEAIQFVIKIEHNLDDNWKKMYM